MINFKSTLRKVQHNRLRLVVFATIAAMGIVGCSQSRPRLRRETDTRAAARLRPPEPRPQSPMQTPALSPAAEKNVPGDSARTPIPLDPLSSNSSSPAAPATKQDTPAASSQEPSPPVDVQVARKLVDQAIAVLNRSTGYSCRVSRQERVGNRVLSREVMQMKFRSQPRSVYYKWLDERNTGREVVYVEGQNDGKVVSRGGTGDFLLAGRTLRVDPDGLLARSKSRYSVHESGMDNMVRRLETVVRLLERGDSSRGPLEYRGVTHRPEVSQPLHYIRHTIPLGADPNFPKGGVRHWYFNAESGLLALMHAEDPQGEFIEYYLFEEFAPSDSLSDRDFDPAAFGGKNKQ